MGCSATPQRRRLLLPSPGGCPGGQRKQAPPLLSFRLARKDPTHTALSKGAPVSSALACSAPGTSRFWPTRYPGRESPRRRRRAKAAPGRMLLPDSPYAERLQRARASLCAASASRRGLARAAVCRRGSSPSPSCPPPPPVPRPPSSQRLTPAASSLGLEMRPGLQPRCLGRHPRWERRSSLCAKPWGAGA